MDFGLSSDGELFAGGMDQDSPYWVCAFAKYAAAIEKANTLSSRLSNHVSKGQEVLQVWCLQQPMGFGGRIDQRPI